MSLTENSIQTSESTITKFKKKKMSQKQKMTFNSSFNKTCFPPNSIFIMHFFKGTAGYTFPNKNKFVHSNSVSRVLMYLTKIQSSYRIHLQHTLHSPHVQTLASLPKALSNNSGHVSFVSLHKSTSVQVLICHTVRKGETCGVL